MGAMSPMHWLIVIGVLVLLFGAKKLPDMARSIGRSARVFKGEMKDLQDDGKPVAGTEQAVVEPGTGGRPPAQAEVAADPSRADAGTTPGSRANNEACRRS